MATKAEERKALEQIRKIIEGLGNDSYIGIAVEGMLEDAAENIENDFALSMKDRFDHQQKINAELEDRYQKAKAEVELARRTVVEESERRKQIAARLQEAENNSVDQITEIIRLREQAKEQADRIEEQADQIIRLKAKLYDLMTAEA